MEVRELIQKFKDNNKIMENDTIVGMIAYGSRVNHYEKNNSDLDVMLLSSGPSSYWGAQVIDGVKVDISVISLDVIDSLIDFERNHNDRYFSSVFNTGLVEKNVNGIIDYLKDEINSRYAGGIDKREIKPRVKLELGNLYQSFIDSINSTIYEDYLYYNLLEKIRENYNYMHNCSRLTFSKAYDLFINNHLMRVYYQLKLPKQDFIDAYLVALKTTDGNERKVLLDRLFAMIDIDSKYLDIDEDIFVQSDELPMNEIKYHIVYLREKIKRVEEMLISNHPASIPVYYIILYRLRKLLFQINKDDALNAEEDFNKALLAFSNDERIKYLEAFFTHIDKKFNLDYDNYLIKRF